MKLLTAREWMRIRNFLSLGAIVGALPNSIQNGQTADAIPVMANYNWIVNQVNSNAAQLSQTPQLAGANTFTQLNSGIAATAGANYPIFSQIGDVFLGSVDAAASATVDLTGYFTSTYNEYRIVMTDIQPATDGANLELRISQATVFKSGAVDYAWAYDGNATSGGAFATSSSGSTFAQIAAALSNANTSRNFSGELRIFNPSGTALGKMIKWAVSYFSSVPSFISLTGGASYYGGTSGTPTAAIDGLRFLMSAGNITSGNFTVFGIRKT